MGMEAVSVTWAGRAAAVTRVSGPKAEAGDAREGGSWVRMTRTILSSYPSEITGSPCTKKCDPNAK